MISVQNRQLLLNGNNFFLFLLIFCGFSSCAAKKITSAKNVEVVAINTNGISKKEDSVKTKAVAIDIFDAETTPKTPSNPIKIANEDPTRIHNIVVLLPFFLDQIPLGNYVDDSTKVLSADSKNAMDFYLGCQLARQNYNSPDLNVNVYFMDDKNDSLKIANSFKSKPFPNVDYIVGPITGKNLKIASSLAKYTQINMISPVVNSMFIKDNPYYFNANASLKSQYSFILEQLQKQNNSKTLEIIYDGLDSTAENISNLKYIVNDVYKLSNVKYISLRATDDISKSLVIADTLSERVAIIYSSKEPYVKSILAKIKPIKNHFSIYTSSCLKNSKGLADLKLTDDVFCVYPYNTSNANNAKFAVKFEALYQKKPTDLCFQAYDIMMHLFSLIENKQHLQDNLYSVSSNSNNTQTKFQFKPIINKNGEIDFYDNTFMYQYKLSSGSFVLTNP
ncbi:MAG: amino acid ABC transporter substrate-binding protein [Chitinophagales bacterium]|nr:amino acid ABC transporter substrate-binding protein [Chitinophagales bacterium]